MKITGDSAGYREWDDRLQHASVAGGGIRSIITARHRKTIDNLPVGKLDSSWFFAAIY